MEMKNLDFFLRFKTKLAASLARSRIKHDLLSMECILPECVRKKQQRSCSLPLYAWVNRLKSSHDEVQGVLKNDGLLQVKSIRQLAGQTFCQDSHCWDTLVFPAQLKAPLSFTKLLRDHKLIIQDKSCILPTNAAASLLPDEGDILMVGCFSGLTVAHTASLIAEKYEGDKNNNDQPMVYVCTTDITERQSEEIQHTVDKMGCKNVKLLQQGFQSLDADDKHLRNVRVILLIPRCSMSAVSNTVKFILQENGDPGLLQDLSHGSIAQSKLEDLAAQQRKDFGHALKFPQVLVVVYCTCSSCQTENEDVVNGVLQEAKASSDQDGEPKQSKFRLSPLHLSSCDQAEATNEKEPFFLLEPSELNNGCFLAVLMRKPEPVVKEAPEDVIAKANTRGILDRIGSNRPDKKENHTRTSIGHTRRLQAKPWSSIPLKHPPQSSRNRNRNSSSSSIQQGHINTQQPQQQAQPKGRHFQPVKSSAVRVFWDSRQKYSTSSAPASSTHPQNDTPTKIISHALNMTSSSTSRTAPPAPPVAPLLRPSRAQEVLKPVVLVLPPVHFPSFLPPQRSGSGVSHSPWYSKKKTPPQPVYVFPSKGTADKSPPLFPL
ncbi:putative methyltransferase NSUN7 [Gouania willdenowi]|uniref:putative methyltransferase NSUN7 n=1 Tax=Gouania willdenowi TaxID=441366 RepID=UPI0010563D69|nr:putative methyltransferase NSUN7 [Gouania willdenowi]